LKQSAIDPLSGKIDISILTTGMSLAARKRRQELVEALKKLIKEKDKAPTLNYQKIFTELKESSSMVSLFQVNIVYYIIYHILVLLLILYKRHICFNPVLILVGDT
jgi:DNA replicative helicase MCM subunit Mcm2 (Cdc46/Mcm family)